ncbi:hypothetical protein AWM75_05270 [Aerococcus urinaehominis]|uniref:Single-stranded DNA-binding protein n=1 Tax=Aerococcus urinaehominis TaxID=128944 RepID=A0A0X8FLT3_9LACT|nr:single-stranded DNA-binding protein [Aerococcus urinaehominis]AMB99439.1 hypothetical protein AWM75_05270 [Aerococcus urinaehominis]SDM28967.1 single-strand DNA-binding protein [Aerococcus urinaehominis]
MNQFQAIGRLAREVDLKEFSNTGNAVLNNVLAIPRSFNQDKDRTDFIPIVAWNATGKLMARYLKKGDEIAIIGNLQSRSYENKEGQTVYTVEVNVRQVQFLRKKQENLQEITINTVSNPN